MPFGVFKNGLLPKALPLSQRAGGSTEPYSSVSTKKKTRNSRKIATEDWERVGTDIMSKGCTWTVYVSQRAQTGEEWILGWTHKEHSHSANLDPFTFAVHKAKKPGYLKAVKQAEAHRGAASYSTSSKMLPKQGLPVLTKKEYYNSVRRQMRAGDLLDKKTLW
jgi:hypothetical protein